MDEGTVEVEAVCEATLASLVGIASSEAFAVASIDGVEVRVEVDEFSSLVRV